MVDPDEPDVTVDVVTTAITPVDLAKDDLLIEDNTTTSPKTGIIDFATCNISIVPSTPGRQSPVTEAKDNDLMETNARVAKGREEMTQLLDEIKVCKQRHFFLF